MFRLSKGKVKRGVRQEISLLKAQYRAAELKPCYGDADIKKKDNDLSRLLTEIYSLQKQVDDFKFPIFQMVK